MKVAQNFANAPAPKPGSTRAISQHKAISMGYEAAPSEKRVDTKIAGGDKGKTGETSVPGLTTRSIKKRM